MHDAVEESIFLIYNCSIHSSKYSVHTKQEILSLWLGVAMATTETHQADTQDIKEALRYNIYEHTNNIYSINIKTLIYLYYSLKNSKLVAGH